MTATGIHTGTTSSTGRTTDCSTARRAVLTAERRLELDEVPLNAVGQDEITMRVALCGLCATDLHFWQGHLGARFPLVLGHEFIGEVAAIGSRAAHRHRLSVGDHIAAEMLLPCGMCARCREGRYNLCDEDDPFEDGFVGREYGCNIPGERDPGLWGGFASYLHVPREAIVHHVPTSLAWEEAVFVEPLAVAFHAVARARVAPGDDVAIVGCGPIGIMLAMAARAAGADRIAITGIEDDHLQRAPRFGVDSVIDVRTGQPERLVRQALGGPPDVVIEAAGTPSAQVQALKLVRRGGRVVLVGACGPASLTIEPDPDLLLREIDVLPSFLSSGGYEPAIALLARRAWPVHELMTHRFGLEGLNAVFARIVEGELAPFKAAVDPWLQGGEADG